MNRRTFIRAALLGLAAPSVMIRTATSAMTLPEPVKVGRLFVVADYQQAIRQAVQALADKIDEDLFNLYRGSSW